MEFIDERYKDASPEDTVQKIKKILEDAGICVTEDYHDPSVANCYSIRITIDGTNFGTNGKGVSKELSKASGYAEMMERLQSGWLGSGNLEYQDAVLFTKEELIEHCGEWLQYLSQSIQKNENKTVTVEELAQFCISLDGDTHARAVPFYNVFDDKMTYFPCTLLRIVYSTNGLAAGNSMEEALVQGFSEIFERTSKRTIMYKSIVPPTIPDKELKKYKTAYESITAIRNAGLNVSIKDCTQNSPFPVIGVTAIDKIKHQYFVHMACSPVFEIALERCLTETFQGRTLDNITTVKELLAEKNYHLSGTNVLKNMVQSIGSYPVEFFCTDEKNQYHDFTDFQGKSNKTFLSQILHYINSLGFKVLIRNYSHMGFHTYRIIVPGMSEIFLHRTTCQIPLFYILNKNQNLLYDVDGADKSQLIMQLLLLKEIDSTEANPSIQQKAISFPTSLDGKKKQQRYLTSFAFYEWECGSKDSAIAKIANIHLSAQDENEDYLSCLLQWYQLSKLEYSNQEIATYLSPFYCENSIATLLDVFQTGKNPFRRFLFQCPRDCSHCVHQSYCLKKADEELIDIVNQYVTKFDNKAAFQTLRQSLTEIFNNF